jgi:uncharacterized membrane protein YbhN (UPF0104 family)
LLTKTAKKLASFSLKAAVLVLAFVFIYHQYLEKGDKIKHFEQLLSHIDQRKVVFTLTAVCLLMLVNWTLESVKWKYLTREFHPISVWQAIEAVFCGLTWAIFTPNRLGEYAGRVLFLPNRKRIYGIFAMAVGSYGQNVITNVVGLASVIWFLNTFLHLKPLIYFGVIFWSSVFTVFIAIVYFHIIWVVNILDKIPYVKKYHRFFDIMARYKKPELIKIILFCLARYSVFSFQYYLVIHLLIPDISAVPMMLMVFILFFVQSALPSLDLLDIGVRNGTAAYLFSFITGQQIAVMAAVSSIWLINLIIPAILGSAFVFNLKFFDRNS